MNTQPLAPLWDDARILEEVTLRVQEQKKWGAIHRICQRIRDDERATLLAQIETLRITSEQRGSLIEGMEEAIDELMSERATLLARVAGLEAQLAEAATRWEPVAQSLEYDLITHAIKYGEIPQDYRICRKVSGEGGQDGE